MDNWQAAFEHALDAIFVANDKGQYVEVNSAACELVGYSKAELLKLGVFDLTTFGSRNAFDELWTAFLQTGITEGEIALRCKDGSLRWVDYRAVANVEPGLHVSVARDITERKNIEDKLRESEERLQLAQEAAKIGSFEFDIQHDQSAWSRELEEVYGFPERGSIGGLENWRKRVHPEDWPNAEAAFRKALESGTFSAEYRIHWPDGTIRWLYSRATVFHDENGRPLRMVGVSMDITERKRYDEERDDLLRREQSARQEAESANQAKDRFLAMVSHELRSPLTAILGWTRLLQARKLDQTMTARALDVIQRSATTQAQMIEDLLDFSRIVAGKLRLAVEKVEVQEIIHNVVESLSPTADSRSVKIQTEPPPPGLHVYGDPMRLQQILHNLVSNAIKFTPAGGHVSVTMQADETDVTIRVSDTGAGIAKDFLPHVFESFRQAETGATKRHGGLGLGLAIVKRLVEMHHGTISADSAGPGSGSTFTVEIPRTNVARETFEREMIHTMQKGFSDTERSDRLKGLRILLVDDQAVVLKMLQAYLERQGAEVLPCATAGDALAKLQEWMPDVLLSDIAMPDEDGLALISRVRLLESTPARDVPAIALTAHTHVDDRLKALSAGFQSFVSKHVEPAELVSTIANLVRNRS